MFEGRVAEYRQGLIEGIEPHLKQSESARVLALTQLRFPPSLVFLPYAIGVIGFAGSVVFPPVLSVALVVIGIAGVAAGFRIPRRMLVRTDERLHVFKLPSSGSSEVEAPLKTYRAAKIPADLSGRVPKLDGDAVYPGYGAAGEREAIAKALGPGDDL